MGNIVFTFFAWIFAAIAILLGQFLLLDLIMTSATFIFTGNFSSVLDQALERIAAKEYFFSFDSWRLNTRLIGLDLIINWFIGLQFDELGRWIMFALCLGLTILAIFFGAFFDFEMITKSSNPKTPDDISAPVLAGSLIAFFCVLPLIFGLLSFFLETLFETLKALF